jgi:hypothetical protein
MAFGVRPAPWLIAAVLALAWLAFGPPTPDLAAQVYRSELFQSEGFTVFNANWYGGHHTPAYPILFPPLGALLWGALWFGAGTVADLLTPYWRITRGRGCVMRSTAGWTLLYALSSGSMRVETAFDPRRLITRDARCTRSPQTYRSQV